jgi:protein TonB
MFDQLVVSSAVRSKTNKRWTVALSAAGQTFLLGLLILAPLVYTEALPNGILKTMLVAPPPPAAPPPTIPTRSSRARVIELSHLTAPTSIPPRIEIATNEPPVVYVDSLPGSDGVGNGLSDLLRPATPIVPTARTEQKPPDRIRVGGVIENAMLINRVMPQYPAIARTAHVSGTVVLHAIIAKDGAIEELSYVSGPPLLLKTAMDAVKQWRYRPTLLNGEPVEVETTIDVVFNLGG